MTLKQQFYTHYLQIVDERVSQLQKKLADLKDIGSNETKSTAGDKHETALAMLQIEQAQVRSQLEDAMGKKRIMERIDPTLHPVTAVPGSLLKTSRGYFFISIGLGRAVINGITCTALSPQSPLGAKLIGLAPGNTAQFNLQEYLIEAIE